MLVASAVIVTVFPATEATVVPPGTPNPLTVAPGIAAGHGPAPAKLSLSVPNVVLPTYTVLGG